MATNSYIHRRINLKFHLSSLEFHHRKTKREGQIVGMAAKLILYWRRR